MFASQQIRSQPNCLICSTPFVFFCSLLVGWQLRMRDGRPSTAHGRHQGRHERHWRRPGHGAAVFWLGFSFWRGHLGASLDRDFASPGLLGVRWDGPAGGSTWGGPTGGRRPADGGATYVSAPLPLLGAWGAKSSRSVPGTLLVPPGGAGSAPPSGPKNGQGTDV